MNLDMAMSSLMNLTDTEVLCMNIYTNSKKRTMSKARKTDGELCTALLKKES